MPPTRSDVRSAKPSTSLSRARASPARVAAAAVSSRAEGEDFRIASRIASLTRPSTRPADADGDPVLRQDEKACQKRDRHEARDGDAPEEQPRPGPPRDTARTGRGPGCGNRQRDAPERDRRGSRPGAVDQGAHEVELEQHEQAGHHEKCDRHEVAARGRRPGQAKRITPHETPHDRSIRAPNGKQAMTECQPPSSMRSGSRNRAPWSLARPRGLSAEAAGDWKAIRRRAWTTCASLVSLYHETRPRPAPERDGATFVPLRSEGVGLIWIDVRFVRADPSAVPDRSACRPAPIRRRGGHPARRPTPVRPARPCDPAGIHPGQRAPGGRHRAGARRLPDDRRDQVQRGGFPGRPEMARLRGFLRPVLFRGARDGARSTSCRRTGA